MFAFLELTHILVLVIVIYHYIKNENERNSGLQIQGYDSNCPLPAIFCGDLQARHNKLKI